MRRILFVLPVLIGITILTGCGRSQDEVQPMPEEARKKAEEEIRAGQEKAMQEKMKGRRGGPPGRPR